VRRDARTLTLLLVGRISGERSDGLCRIRNISPGGLMAEVFAAFEVGETVHVELRNGQSLAGTVRWTRDGGLGIEFIERVEDIGQLLSEQRSTGAPTKGPKLRAPRLPTDCSADIQVDGRHHLAAVANVSQCGACIATTMSLEPNQLLTLTIAGLPVVQAGVRWVKDGEVGLCFTTPLAFATLAVWLEDSALRYNRRA